MGRGADAAWRRACTGAKVGSKHHRTRGSENPNSNSTPVPPTHTARPGAMALHYTVFVLASPDSDVPCEPRPASPPPSPSRLPSASCGSGGAAAAATTPRAGDSAALTRLEHVQQDFIRMVDTDVDATGHLWHLEGVHLDVAVSTSSSSSCGGVPALRGTTVFGDNIEDEWLIVHWLLRLTTRHNDVVVRVYDDDGEFLLIEAAWQLPEWLQPEDSTNRVFLHNGCVHLLPPDVWRRCAVVGGVPGAPHHATPLPVSLPKVLATVIDAGVPTQAPDGVQTAIRRRTDVHPAAAATAVHSTCCLLPVPVAAVLALEPRLASAAVAAFYTRSLEDVEAAAAMATFPPSDPVLVRVKMTRCMYAQLALQRYHPPKCFADRMPPQSSPQHAAWDIGMKLASGFEMLACRAAASAAPAADTDAGTDTAAAVARRPGWPPFRRHLLDMGYFAGVSPGSAAFGRRQATAEAHFLASPSATDGADGATPTGSATTPGSSNSDAGVAGVIHAAAVRVQQLLACTDEAVVEPVPPDAVGDDVSWLQAGHEELDAALRQRELELQRHEAGLAGAGDVDATVGAGGGAATTDADAVVSSMAAFIGRQSDFEGVEPVDGPPAAATADAAPDGSDTDDSDDDGGVVGAGAAAATGLDVDSLMAFLRGDAAPLAAAEDGRPDSDGSESLMTSGGESDDGGPNVPASGVAAAMAHMDRELRHTTLVQSFVSGADDGGRDDDDDGDGDGGADGRGGQVDAALNLVTNWVQSVGSQAGQAGPATNVLGDMGVALPPDWLAAATEPDASSDAEQ